MLQHSPNRHGQRQVLLSYKLNWQSVMFIGYGDDRMLSTQDRFEKVDRQSFVKLSYASSARQGLIMTTHRIGRIVVDACGGLVVALASCSAGRGAEEHVITGTVLLAFAASWGLLAALSTRWPGSPAMGGDARRLHGIGRRWSASLRAERLGHRRAWWAWRRSCFRSSQARSLVSTAICTAHRSWSCTRC